MTPSLARVVLRGSLLLVLLAPPARAQAAASAVPGLQAERRENPDDPALRLKLAEALVQSGRLAEAVEQIPPASTHRELLLLRAKALLWLGRLPEAKRELLDASPSLRDDVDWRLCLADVALAGHEPALAREQLVAVLTAVPNHPLARSLMTRALGQLLESPATSARSRVRLRAEQLGLAAEPPGNPGFASTLVAELAAAPPAELDTWMADVRAVWFDVERRERLLVDASRRAQRDDLALAQVAPLVELHPEDEGLQALAGDLACSVAWRRLSENQPAVTARLAYAGTPRNKPACLLMAAAQAEMALGNFAAASGIFAKLAKQDESNPDILFGSAEAALASNSLDEANRLLLKLEADAKTDKKRVRNLRLGYDLRSAGRALDRGQFALAEQFARHGMQQDPSSPDAVVLVAAALQRQERLDEAVRVLREGLAKQPSAPGLLSMMARVPGNHSHADFAKRALAVPQPTDPAAQMDLALCLGDAWVEDGDLDQAEIAYRAVFERFPNADAVHLRLASIAMRRQDPFSALPQIRPVYNRSRSFEAALSLADASHALNLERDTFRLLREALEVRPGQGDAQGFLARLEAAHAPTLTPRVTHTWDNGTNQSWEYGLRGSTDLHPDLRVSVDAMRREASTVTPRGSSSMLAARAFAKSQVNERLALTLGLGAGRIAGASGAAFMPLGQARLDARAGARHRLSAGYEADVFGYTAGMMDAHVGLHVLAATANGPIWRGLSYYSAPSVAYLTDRNYRGVWFNSLYYVLLDVPTIKLGLNGQLLGFSSTTLRTYFSPSRLLNGEVFAEIMRDGPDARLLYGALIALGQQQIEHLIPQDTYRVSGLLGARPVPFVKVLLSGQTSNSSSTSVTGFKYYELGGSVEVAF